MSYDEFLGALCIFREARGASMPAKVAIWWVLRNRAADPRARWPKTIAGCVTEPYQFSSFNKGDPNSTLFPDQKQIQDWDAWQDCQDAVMVAIGGDPTDGATNYHSIPDGQPLPSWADSAKLTVTIGPFKFYRL